MEEMVRLRSQRWAQTKSELYGKVRAAIESDSLLNGHATVHDDFMPMNFRFMRIKLNPAGSSEQESNQHLERLVERARDVLTRQIFPHDSPDPNTGKPRSYHLFEDGVPTEKKKGHFSYFRDEDRLILQYVWE